MYQTRVRPGHHRYLLAHCPLGVHPKERYKSIAVWEDSDQGTGPVSNDLLFCLVHAYWVYVCPSHHVTIFLMAGRESGESR